MTSLKCIHNLQKKHKHKNKGLIPKMPSITYVNTLYNSKNINNKACFQNGQYNICKYSLQTQKHYNKGSLKNTQQYLCTYPLQQHKHKHKVLFPKYPVLRMYIPYTQNTNINTKVSLQNAQYYICTYPQQEHKHNPKGSYL